MSSTNNLNYIFHLLDFIVGGLFCVDAYFVISTANNLPRFVLPIYYFAFGLIIITVVFYAPVMLSNMLIFYWTFIGRSFSFLFLAAPLIAFGSTLDVGCGIYTAFVGFLYLTLAIITVKRCAVINTSLPPPIFQRNEALPSPNSNKNDVNVSESGDNQPQKQKPKKWKYKEKQKKNGSGWRWNKKKNDSPYTKQKSNDSVDAGACGNIQDRMGMYDNAIASDNDMTDKLDQMKQDRNKDIKTLDSEKKQQATDVLQKYANNQAAHVKDINALNNEIKDINKSNAVSKMINLGLMSEMYVKKDVFERYSSQNTYSNMLLDGNNNDMWASDDEYIKMYVLNMMNSGLLTKLTEEQAIEFETLLLYSLETVDQLYMVELTRSNLNNVLLEKIINVLIGRSNNEFVFGPEIFHCESNNITDAGMKFIINYIDANDKDLKVIKAGHMFNTISSETCKLVGEVLDEKNEYLLKLSIDIQWAQYQTTIDKALTRNNNMFRKQRNEHTEIQLSENMNVDNDRKEEMEPVEMKTEMIYNDNNAVIIETKVSDENNMIEVDMNENNPFFNENVETNDEKQSDLEVVVSVVNDVNNNEDDKGDNDVDVVNNPNVIDQTTQNNADLDDNYV